MWLPIAFPDESFYSRIIRGFTISGERQSDFLITEFNNSRMPIHPYLTSGLGAIANCSTSEINEIICQQTLIKTFMYFLPKNAEAIKVALFENNCGAVMRACNFVSFKETEELSIKYCPACAKSDVLKYGLSYWHISHQVPGVESCSEHQVKLNRTALPARTYLRSFFLPPCNSPEKQSSETMFEFAKYVKKLTFNEIPNGTEFDLINLRDRLLKAGYMLKSGSIKNTKLTSDLLRLAEELSLTEGMLKPLQNTKTNYVYHLLMEKVTQHPFKYLLVLFLLSTNEEVKPLPEVLQKKSDCCEEKCLAMLKCGMPILRIHESTGKSRTYIKQLALLNNISIKTIPRTIDPSITETALKLAYKGFHRGYIAKYLEVSIGSIEQIISTEAGLVQKRKRFKFESKRRRFRANILRCMQLHPTAIKQEIKQQCYTAFHWLYRHDKDWLNDSLPRPCDKKFQPTVDWAERDTELSKRVNKLMSTISPPISLTKLDKMIGGHRWLLKYKSQLPLTMNIYRHLNYMAEN